MYSEPLFEFDGILRTLQYASTTGNALLWVMKNNHAFFIIRGPAPHRAYVITLPNTLAFFGIIMNFQIT